jgi:hypothetical protein
MVALFKSLKISQGSCNSRAIEHHYSRVKEPFRGTPSIQNSIYGAHYVHLSQARQDFGFVDAKLEEPMKKELALRDAKVALKAACELSSHLCLDQSPRDLLQTFQAYMDSQGSVFLTKGNLANTDEPEDECDSEDEAILEEIMQFLDDEDAAEGILPNDLSDEVLEQPTHHFLASLEDQNKVKKAIAEIMQEFTELEIGAESTPTVSASVPVGGSDDVARSLPDMLEKVAHLDEFQPLDNCSPRSQTERCLKRLSSLEPHFKAFVELVAEEQGILSAAKIKQGGQPSIHKNRWNFLASQLALARQNSRVSCGGGTKAARAVGWAKVQQGFAAAAKAAQLKSEGTVVAAEEEGEFFAPRSYRGCNSARLQFLAFKLNESAPVKVGVVVAVFRGSTCKFQDGEEKEVKEAPAAAPKAVAKPAAKKALAKPAAKKAPRSSRVTKPVATHLPVVSTTRLHVVELQSDEDDGSFFASCLSPIFVIDPVGTVRNELRAEATVSGKWELSASFSDEVLEYLIYIDGLHPDAVPAALPPQLVPLIESEQPIVEALADAQKPRSIGKFILSHRSFPKRQKGFEAMASFMEQLPRHYEQVRGRSLLVDDKINLDGVMHEWPVLCARVAGFFEIQYSLLNTTFSKAVFNHFLSIVPILVVLCCLVVFLPYKFTYMYVGIV